MGREEITVLLATMFYIMNTGLLLIVLQVIFIGVVTDLEIALLATIYWVPVLFLSPIWGYLGDSMGRYKLLVSTSLIILAIITHLHRVYTSYGQILLLRILAGVVSASYGPLIQAYITHGVSRRRYGRIISIYNTGIALGFLASGYMVSILLFLFDPWIVFDFASLTSIISATLVASLPRKMVERSHPKIVEALGSMLSIRAVFEIRRGRAYLLFIALSLRNIAIMGLFSVVYVYMQRRGVPTYMLGFLSSFNNLAQVLLIPIFGVMADKFGRKAVFVPGFLLSSIIPLIFLFSTSCMDFALAFAFIGLAYSLLVSGSNPYLRDVAPKGHESEVLALMSTSRAVGMIVGPVLVGTIILASSYTIMFVSLTLLGLMATIISSSVVENYENPTVE